MCYVSLFSVPLNSCSVCEDCLKDHFSPPRRYLGKENSAKHGRSEVQYKYLELPVDEVGSTLWKQMSRVCQDVPVQDNFYLSWYLRGSRGFDPSSKPNYAPPYLTREGFNKLKVSRPYIAIHGIYMVPGVMHTGTG